MLVHEFICINKDQIPASLTYNLIEKFVSVKIDDETIQNESLFFTGFYSYWCAWGNKNLGLCYHGISIIPNEQLPKLLFELRVCNNHNLADLIVLCDKAIAEKMEVIYFGV